MAEVEDGWLVKKARWIENNGTEYGPTLMVAIAGLGWTLGRSFILEWPTEISWQSSLVRVALGVGLTFTALIGAVFVYRRSGKIRSLKEDKRELEKKLEDVQEHILRITSSAKEVWRIRLAHIAQDLGLDDTFRISIYRYSPGSRVFVMLGSKPNQPLENLCAH